jgi:hypothetical protein
MYCKNHIILLCTLLAACNAQPAQQGKTKNMTGATTKMEEGKDYMLLKRFRVTDNQGFSQPIEVSSFLLPADWQVNGTVQWNATSKCLPGMLQASVQAASPDNGFELLVLPVTQFDWSTDAVYLDAMQRGFNLHSCEIARPLDAAGYIGQALAPQLKAQVKSAKAIDALQQAMDQGAAQMTQAARAGGNNAYSHRGSAAEGLLAFADGREGLAFCTVMQTIVTMPGAQGGMSENSYCYVSMRVVLKYKSGNEAMARKIMSTFFSSARINPQWGNAVQQFFANVSRNAQDETWKQIQISHQAQQEIGNNIIRSWEAKNSASAGSGGSGDNNAQFGQYLRGVENYTDEGGNKVELTSGYNYAWGRGDGSYVMSNNPAFDPNIELQGTQSWGRLNK